MKNKAKRVRHLESVAIGAGFLLKTLELRYANDFSEGIRIQVKQCLHDIRQIEHTIKQREQQAQAQNQPNQEGR